MESSVKRILTLFLPLFLVYSIFSSVVFAATLDTTSFGGKLVVSTSSSGVSVLDNVSFGGKLQVTTSGGGNNLTLLDSTFFSGKITVGTSGEELSLLDSNFFGGKLSMPSWSNWSTVWILYYNSSGNQSPILSNPNPANGSTNQPTTLVWSIQINDPEGDTFNWSIECSNGQSNSGNNDINGTKSLSLSGLSYSTNYTIYVNATDSGSSSWTNATYWFITTNGNAPIISNPYPSNGSTGISLQLTCHIQVNDSNGDTMTIYWYENTTGSWVLRQTNSSVSNGTYYWTYTQANSEYTWYYWKVAVNDSTYNTTSVYHFRTADTTPPASVAMIKDHLHYQNASTSGPSYFQVESISDTGSGIKEVRYYTRFSSDNSSWSAWSYYQTNASGPPTYDSTSIDKGNGQGYYQVYSIAEDNANNNETPPTSYDDWYVLDTTDPTSSVDTISPYEITSSPLTINITASDNLVGVNYVELYYRYSSDNSSWGNWHKYDGNDSTSPYQFSFNFPDGNGYYEFYSKSTDLCRNTESYSSVDARCYYHTMSTPILSNEYPTNGTTGVHTQPTCHITVYDADNDTVTVRFYENTTGSWILRQTNVTTNTTNSPIVYWTYTQANQSNTTYWWKVIANDSYNTTSSIYHFTTIRPGVSLDSNVYFEVENFTLHPKTTVTEQEASVCHSYLIMSNKNITFITNISSESHHINTSSSTNITFDLYAPSDYTASITMKLLRGSTVKQTYNPSSYTQDGDYRHYRQQVSLTENGSYNINISTVVQNTTIYYEGYSYESNILSVVGNTSVITNESTGVEEYNATLHGYLVDDGGDNCTVGFEYGVNTSYGSDTVNSYYSYSSNSWGNPLGLSDTYKRVGRKINGFTGYILNASFDCKKVGTPPGHVRVTVRYQSNDTIAYQSEKLASSLPTSNTWVAFSFYNSTLIQNKDIYVLLEYGYDSSPDNHNYVKYYYIGYGDVSKFVGYDTSYHIHYPINSKIYYSQSGYKTSPSEFKEDVSSLTPGQLYHYRAYATNSYGTSYGSDKTFLTKPLPPTLSTSSYNHTHVSLTWTKGSGANNTIIRRSTTGYPTLTTGTLIYNDTGTSYDDTSVNPATKYYYSAWSYTSWDSLHQHSDSNSSIVVTTLPQPPQNTTYNLVTHGNTANLTINWDKGIGADTTLIRKSSPDYPSTPADGTLVYNGTSNTTIDTNINQAWSYTLWSYNSTYNIYSEPVYLNWTAIWLMVYNESSGELIQPWSAVITNQEGTQAISISSSGNPYILNTSECPHGANTLFVFSAPGYKQRSYYYNIQSGNSYTIKAYLPPEQVINNPSGGGSSDNSQNDTCETRTKYDVAQIVNNSQDVTISFTHNPTSLIVVETFECSQIQYQTKNDIQSVTNTSQDLTINTSHPIHEIIGVYVYNASSYGQWVSVPDDKYTHNTTSVTINRTAFDDNTTMAKVYYYYIDYSDSLAYGSWIAVPNNKYSYNSTSITVNHTAFTNNSILVRVTYYYLYCYSMGTETPLYTLQIVGWQGEFTSPPIEDAKITVKKYMNTTSQFETVAILLTDANGQADVYLMPGTLYKIIITKDDYETEYSDYIPTPETKTRTFRLTYSPTATPVYTFYDLINVSTGWYSNGFYVVYNDTTGSTVSANFSVYGASNHTLLYSKVITSSNYNFTYTGNTTYNYLWKIDCQLSNPAGNYSSGLIPAFGSIEPVVSNSTLNNIISIILGPSPIYYDQDKLGGSDHPSASVSWAYIIIFIACFIWITTFGKLNISIAGMGTGSILIFSGAVISGVNQLFADYTWWSGASLILIGFFILALSLVYALGGVER